MDAYGQSVLDTFEEVIAKTGKYLLWSRILRVLFWIFVAIFVATLVLSDSEEAPLYDQLSNIALIVFPLAVLTAWLRRWALRRNNAHFREMVVHSASDDFRLAAYRFYDETGHDVYLQAHRQAVDDLPQLD